MVQNIRLLVLLASIYNLALLLGPAGLQAEGQDVRWEEYCRAAKSEGSPELNRSNELVLRALQKLKDKKIQSALHIYPEYRRLLDQNSSIEENFLRLMCAEYRDRPDLLRAKIKLLADLHIVPEGPITYTHRKELWSQLTGEGYRDLVWLIKNLGDLRAERLVVRGDFFHGRPGQASIPPLSECEIRFIFSHYLATRRFLRTEDDLVRYDKEFEGFKALSPESGGCFGGEDDYFVDFRGDGVLRPRSPEANAMEIFGNRMTLLCSADKKHKRRESCSEYARSPHLKRLEFSRSILKRTLYPPTNLESLFRDPLEWLVLTEDLNGDGLADIIGFDKTALESRRLAAIRRRIMRPGTMSDPKNRRLRWERTEEFEQGVTQALKVPEKSGVHIVLDLPVKAGPFESPDYGLGGVETVDREALPDHVWARLATSIDRHVAFYQIDFLGLQPPYFRGYLSPWVGSSHYLEQSHKFAFLGFATQMVSNTDMRWMYILRVPRSDYFSAESLSQGQSIDFSRNWFDERTLTRGSLGEEERAWVKAHHVSPLNLKTLLWLGEVQVTPELIDLLRVAG